MKIGVMGTGDVVKAFNIVGNAHMFRPDFPGGPPDMFICGNDADAKQQVRSARGCASSICSRPDTRC